MGIGGVPVLEQGRTYVLFLGEEGPYPTPTVGWGQGLFEVQDVRVAGRRQTVLISYDDEPVELSRTGEIRRGGRVEVRDGVLTAVPDGRVSSAETPRQADPVGLNADGSAASQSASRIFAGNPPLSERNFATLEDLRRFVSGQINEIDHGTASFQNAAVLEFSKWHDTVDRWGWTVGDNFAGANGKNEILFFTAAQTFSQYGISIGSGTFGVTYFT